MRYFNIADHDNLGWLTIGNSGYCGNALALGAGKFGYAGAIAASTIAIPRP
ncbi:hypothetical protein [[Phormidium] sp. ETS-05]|uniref:hypothetical protein n=1 Tax=[Phormidium] sp. ETS-05 TaxID=222819 RepID=UPI0018EF0B32|nr:hypothetical protein [[Phormidium] sp. ETS-05]